MPINACVFVFDFFFKNDYRNVIEVIFCFSFYVIVDDSSSRLRQKRAGDDSWDTNSEDIELVTSIIFVKRKKFSAQLILYSC